MNPGVITLVLTVFRRPGLVCATNRPVNLGFVKTIAGRD